MCVKGKYTQVYVQDRQLVPRVFKTTGGMNMALQQNQYAAWRGEFFWWGTVNIHGLTGNITDSEMYLYMITTENTMTYQWSFFILQNAIYNNVTIHYNQKPKDTMHNLLHTALRRCHLHYVTYTKQSGPFIVSPECRQTVCRHRGCQLLLTGEQTVRTL